MININSTTSAVPSSASQPNQSNNRPTFKSTSLEMDTVSFGAKFTQDEVSKLVKQENIERIASLLNREEITTKQVQIGLNKHRKSIFQGSIDFLEEKIKNPKG